MEIFEPNGLSVLDVENLRLHYALTLGAWLRRYQAHEARVSEMYDERFVRTWRLYLAGSQAAFRVGELQLFQWVFTQRRIMTSRGRGLISIRVPDTVTVE